MDTALPLSQCNLPSDWNWSKVKSINGVRCEKLRDEPDKIRKILGHIPKSAKTPADVNRYIIEWDEKNAAGEHLKNEEPALGRFMDTSGAYFARDYWAERGQVFDHHSLHYRVVLQKCH